MISSLEPTCSNRSLQMRKQFTRIFKSDSALHAAQYHLSMNSLIQTMLSQASSHLGKINAQLVKVLLILLSTKFRASNAPTARRSTTPPRRERTKMKITMSMSPEPCALTLNFKVITDTGSETSLRYASSWFLSSLSAASMRCSETERSPRQERRNLQELPRVEVPNLKKHMAITISKKMLRKLQEAVPPLTDHWLNHKDPVRRRPPESQTDK